MIDWGYLKRKYGIDIFPETLLEHTHGGEGVSASELNLSAQPQDAFKLMASEEQAGIHAFMKIQSMKRQLSDLADEDPEFAGLLLGEPLADKSNDHEEKKMFIEVAMAEISDLEKIAIDPDAP